MIGRKLGFVAFIMLIALVLIPSRASAQWSRCAGEGGTCEMSGPGHHLLRFGGDGNFFYIETDGNVTRVPCNTQVFGDAAYGKDKTCDYTTLGPLDPAVQWTLCASEGDTCKLSSNAPVLVKYASPFDLGRAEYRIASTSFPCGNNYFFDVNEGPPKTCWVSMRPYAQIPVKDGAAKPLEEFTNCGTEGQSCPFPADVEAALMRFGTDGKWVYRLASSTSQIDCNYAVFAMDPAQGNTKFCFYAYVPPHITGLTGGWQRVASCTNCESLVQSVTVGIEGSRAKTTSELFGTEVAVEWSRKFDPVGDIKVSTKFQYSKTESIQDTVSRSVATTKQATCSAPRKKVTMYQWKMNVSDECYALQGQCQSQIYAFDILCTEDDIPAGIPACPSGGPPTNTDCAPAPGG
jgi:hypothetical protein